MGRCFPSTPGNNRTRRFASGFLPGISSSLCGQRSTMAGRPVHPRVPPPAQRDEGRSRGEHASRCPSCKHACDVILMLPCAHPLCVQCIEAAKDAAVRRPPSCCAVPCPCCGRPVELPCCTWASATACLPRYPTLTSEGVRTRTGTDSDPRDRPAQLQGGQSADGPKEGTGPDSAGGGRRWFGTLGGAPPAALKHCFTKDSQVSSNASSVTAVDGATDLADDDMTRSVYGLRFALKPCTAHPSLRLCAASLSVSLGEESREPSLTSDPCLQAWPTVGADAVLIRGQYYWEVEVSNSAIYRIGVAPRDGRGGWWLQRRGRGFSAVYDGGDEPLSTVPPHIKTIGVFLCIGAGTLSFHNPLTEEHLVTLPTYFGWAGVVLALGLGQGRLRLRSGLPPPPHVFFYKNSGYREPRRGQGGRWHVGEVPFRSVKTVIEKFEAIQAGVRARGEVNPPPADVGRTEHIGAGVPTSV